MLDKASLGHALQMQFRWNTFEGPILNHRKAYNVACLKHDRWLLLRKLRANLAHNTQVNQQQQHARTTTSTPGLVPPSPGPVDASQSQIFTTQSTPPMLTVVGPDEDAALLADMEVILTETSPLTPEQEVKKQNFDAAATAYAATLAVPPTQKLSRTMRVFVAWKAPAPPSSPV